MIKISTPELEHKKPCTLAGSQACDNLTTEKLVTLLVDVDFIAHSDVKIHDCEPRDVGISSDISLLLKVLLTVGASRSAST